MKKKILIPLLAIITIVITATLIDSLLHTYSDKPENSDAIIILGGGDQGRVEEAASLYKSGYADKVIITPVAKRYTTDELVTIIRHYGIDEEDIIIDETSTSTYTNALRTIEIMDEYNFESALVVTNDYHVKRSKLIFERLNDDSKSFKYISATNLEGEKWYERENAVSHWFGELIKVWGYRLGLYNFFD